MTEPRPLVNINVFFVQSELEESEALLENAWNLKAEKDARIDELEEQVETLQQEKDRLAKEVHSLRGRKN